MTLKVLFIYFLFIYLLTRKKKTHCGDSELLAADPLSPMRSHWTRALILSHIFACLISFCDFCEFLWQVMLSWQIFLLKSCNNPAVI